MRKDLGYEFCRHQSEKNPYRRRASQAYRLLAGVRRRRRAIVPADVENALKTHAASAVAFRGDRARAGLAAHVASATSCKLEGCAQSLVARRCVNPPASTLPDL